jgi:DNA-binding transcriptional MerR regulator
MQVRLSIGDFSRMTYLSVKALRHYHDVGLLEPAEIDPSSGYRFYSPSQVGPAQMIRRLRELGMPLDDVRTIVRASDPQVRDEALVAHLQRMEQQLAQTQQTVASLRTLLEAPHGTVERRHIAATPALAIAERVAGEQAVAWWMEAFRVLHQALHAPGIARSGPDGALFPTEFFEAEEGHLSVFVPLRAQPAAAVRLPPGVAAITVPSVHVAVMAHEGPFGDLDRTYGALGRWVLERAAGADGPVREYYHPTGDPDDLLAHTTEVCWPVVGAPRTGPPARSTS